MKKKIISLILALALVLPLVPVFNIPVFAESGTTGDCTWTLKDGVLTISGNGAMGDYTNPYSAPWKSWQMEITKIIIEDGVINIGDYAFGSLLNLTSVTIPNSVTSIGKWGFENTFLSSYNIPNSVREIKEGAFSLCGKLTTFTIPDRVTSIGEGAFYGCTSLTSFTIPDSVTSIGDHAFYDCKKLADVWYEGAREDQTKITIGAENAPLIDATWHYNVCFKNPDTNKVHIYDNGCDAECNLCEAERTPPHQYDNACDTECNLCEAERTPPHQYDNACDATCNGCDSTRTVSHDYSVQDKNTETHWMKCSVCDDIDESTRDGHNYEKKGENIATCKACSLSKTFDFIITTDETITLSYEASKEFDFVIEDPSVAKINNVSSSIISMGSYYKQVSSAKVMSVFPGETTVKIVVTDGTVLTSSSLMVVEGQHQMQFSEVLKEPNGTEPGIELHICKFCGHEEEVEIPGYTPGDVDGVEGVTLDDAIYLLYHVNFSTTYPVNQPVDFNGDGKEDLDDAIYLLYHVNFKETYPLH